ncbi:MAG: hypothetical protein ACK53Y_21965, partial [bacterium]
LESLQNSTFTLLILLHSNERKRQANAELRLNQTKARNGGFPFRGVETASGSSRVTPIIPRMEEIIVDNS